MSKPLAIDLFCGLGGWAEGLLAHGWRVVGFDIERHRYPRAVPREAGAVKRPGMNWSDQTKRGAKDAMFNLPPAAVYRLTRRPQSKLIVHDAVAPHLESLPGWDRPAEAKRQTSRDCTTAA